MQLELGAARRAALPETPPRVLALCVPDLPLQRLLRGRGAADGAGAPRESPVAVAHEGRVVCCAPAARSRGVRTGDAVVQARAVCADLEIVALDGTADRAALVALAEAMLAIAPAVEISWPDALLLDASGAHLHGPGGEGETVLAARAVALAADLGYRCRVAVASGGGPARALARHGRAREPVPPESTAAALAGLPISALGLPPAIAEQLLALGIDEVGRLAALPAETLAHRFGAEGLAAARLARGEDPTPLAPHVPDALPEEAIDLETPVESAEPLLFVLRRLADRVAARLAGRGIGATRLALALRLDPRGEERLEIPLARPSSAASRWLLLLRERLLDLRLPAAVAGLALAVSEAAAAPAEQLGLGERPEQLVALEAALSRLAARLGDRALFSAEPVDRHRPEAAYRSAAFQGVRGEAGRKGRHVPGRLARAEPGQRTPTARRAASADEATAPPPSAPVRPTRLLDRPRPLVAEGEGGRLTALRLGGRAFPVVELSAPERLAGEWWNEPFARDYHRARLEGLGDCWIYRDGADGRFWLHGFFD